MVTQEPAPLSVHDRYDDESVRRFHERGWWQGGSAGALLDRWADATPDRRFVSDGTVELTYAEVRARSGGLASALLHAGVDPGDRVAMQLPNWAEFVVGYLAVARLGAVLVPIMTVYRQSEVEHVLRDSGAVAAITTGEFRGFDHAEMFRTLRKEIPALGTLVVARGPVQEDELAFDEACAGATADLGPRPDPDLPHLIVYTSGTESTAKGCVHTWNTADFSARGLAVDVFEARPEDVVFMPSPIAHATGLVVGILVPMTVGAEVHLLDVWEPNEGLRRIERYGCTVSATATPFVRMALDAQREARRDLSSMRFWLCAGAPIPEALAVEFDQAFDGGVLMPLYGATEILAGTCCHPGDPLERRAGSDGSAALDGIEITLVGPDGEDVATGAEGEICYFGPGAVLGYWRDPVRTAAAIDSRGRHHTGDLGRLDEHGYLRVSGRLKDIIIRGGTNISAAEVEGHVGAHPAVAQVAVVPYPDVRLGEKACAVVVPVPGERPTLHGLTGFLRGRGISMQKLPEKLVLVEALPMTATGKVQKFRLRDLARES
ncbi:MULTISPECIES: AMP-binding protein [Pseudonocardia]|uniref:Short-chain-fatty-acid--CoA ligase n=2 Tax=Pseudonocardia TaxID=1847 RepID=A0A1Y2MRH0_PSEAH|nr:MULTISPECIES: AMP-binding protein [Pseudonocardia]OSY37108.1 Short-chain-fatty-acid--CoA ligase [Pseudonocardia autotrophica]TDN72080.1 cyclohexanecarboxylate-CoA ligase/acyl-CoA synthetase [Pseudonocardia autotrophica]BBG02778.1 short chain acyl-CoA synthetase [Pseudonocardia autotrophica]GEC25889.1 short chain acyl-CoA synthetase [Pseudonocardia saturnea]